MKIRTTVALCLFSFSHTGAAQTNALTTLRECCGFGWAVSGLRDVDDDGVTDVIIGANGNGHVYVHSGRTGVRLRDFSLAASELGHAVAEAGDVDADGTSDIVAGAPAFSGTGAIRVWSGRTGAELLAVSGTQPNGRFGHAVAGAGDVNGDGRSDLLVGAYGSPGRAFVISGADGSVLRTLNGGGDNRGFGGGVAKLKDSNGDGLPEHLVAAVLDATVHVFSGADGSRLRTVSGDADSRSFGEFFLAEAGDVDADGRADIFVGDYQANGVRGAAYVFSGADGRRLYKFTGEVEQEGFGTGRGAGDVDGDGRADLIIGSGGFSPPGVNGGGRARLYSGRTGEVLATYTGSQQRANFGFDAVGIGDVNGDTRLDFLISSSSGNRVDIVSGTVLPPAPPTGYAIDAAITGAWYDPTQAGHGIFIEVLPDQRLLAWWFTFDRAGNQAWFGGVGRYRGNRATVVATRTRGGRFIPDFNSAAVSNPSWGTLEFSFSGCNSGLVRFDSDLGFGQDEMPLTRLTLPLGAVCH